jgi:hypothetical protein
VRDTVATETPARRATSRMLDTITSLTGKQAASLPQQRVHTNCRAAFDTWRSRA